MVLKPHQGRVVVEKVELDERLKKLTAFLQGVLFPALPLVERELFMAQHEAMRQYSDVLGARINLWKESPE